MEIEGWFPWEPVRRPLFDGVGWKVFFKIVTVNVTAVGLGHTLDLDQAASARSADGKVFKQESGSFYWRSSQKGWPERPGVSRLLLR
jgi:hypothetical protein